MDASRKIKHIVISGGVEWGFAGFGILHEAMECGFLNMDDVQSMYMCSAGTIIGCMLALKVEHRVIHDYLIKRPWDAVCKQNKVSVFELYDSKGIIHRGFFENMFSPLLKSVDLSVDVSLSDLYKYNSIDLHIYATEMNHFRTIDISHTTHPEWRLIDAIYASSAVPILFQPLFIGEECYMDAGILLNYPIDECLKNIENIDEVLGISLGNYPETGESRLAPTANILDVISTVFTKIVKHHQLFANDLSHTLPYQIHCYQNSTFDSIMNALYSKEYRKTLIYNGIDQMKTEFNKWFSICESEPRLDTADKCD